MVKIPTGLWLDLIDFLENLISGHSDSPEVTAARLLKELKNLAP